MHNTIIYNHPRNKLRRRMRQPLAALIVPFIQSLFKVLSIHYHVTVVSIYASVLSYIHSCCHVRSTLVHFAQRQDTCVDTFTLVAEVTVQYCKLSGSKLCNLTYLLFSERV